MKNNNKKKFFGKSAALALTLIGVSAVSFNVLAEGTMAAELARPQSIPTTYNVTPSEEAKAPEGYKKADYTIIMEDYSETPTSKDLTAEEAAELGAQMLWEIYGADLDGAYIYMGYCSGTETFNRPFWSGDVRFSKKRTPSDFTYSFMLDSVSGDRFNVGQSKQLDVKVPLGADSSLEKDHSEYDKLAVKAAEDYNLVHGAVASTEYNCQGYGSNNNPDITIDVIGTNGERATLTFSRYDQELMGILFDSSRRISDNSLAALEGSSFGEVQEMQAIPQ